MVWFPPGSHRVASQRLPTGSKTTIPPHPCGEWTHVSAYPIHRLAQLVEDRAHHCNFQSTITKLYTFDRHRNQTHSARSGSYHPVHIRPGCHSIGQVVITLNSAHTVFPHFLRILSPVVEKHTKPSGRRAQNPWARPRTRIQTGTSIGEY